LSQRWATFVQNHAHAVVACDFFTMVTARFSVLYVFVVLEVGTRRILRWSVTEHPTAEWTIQQFRTVITTETSHRFVLHDRDSIFAATVERAIASMGRHVLKTPVLTPQANAFCERLIGTMRRECVAVRTQPARVHRSSPPRTRSGDRDTDSGRAAP
jgi:putative transposase